jgi:putative tail fiber assembly protein
MKLFFNLKLNTFLPVYDDSFDKNTLSDDIYPIEDESIINGISASITGGGEVWVEGGKLCYSGKQPSDNHKWDSEKKKWLKLTSAEMQEKQTALLSEQRERIFAKIIAKRDECVNGGVYVERIGKWVDSDEKGRATLVEIKADFDLNGKENTYTLICSDNTAYTLNFDEFKSVWDAVKTLKEKMFENAYMHQILLEQAENPLEYDWSIGWSKTYEESKN